jgi:hypothetical protein
VLLLIHRGPLLGLTDHCSAARTIARLRGPLACHDYCPRSRAMVRDYLQ